jgi:hypothetical protein
MSLRPSRRSFLTAVGSLAGAAAMPSAAGAQGQSDTAADLGWFETFRGRHKQVYDYGGFDLALSEPYPPLRFPRNYLNSIRDTLHVEFPDVNTAVGVTNTAFPLNATDAVWKKYGLGERFKIVDPLTKKPAVRNVFLDGGEFSVKALQARGTVFWQCRFALEAVVQQLAAGTGRPVTEVRADLLEGLNSGVRLVPSHMLALELAQGRNFSYVRV